MRIYNSVDYVPHNLYHYTVTQKDSKSKKIYCGWAFMYAKEEYNPIYSDNILTGCIIGNSTDRMEIESFYRSFKYLMFQLDPDVNYGLFIYTNSRIYKHFYDNRNFQQMRHRLRCGQSLRGIPHYQEWEKLLSVSKGYRYHDVYDIEQFKSGNLPAIRRHLAQAASSEIDEKIKNLKIKL